MDDLKQAVTFAASLPASTEGVLEVYSDLAREIAARRPVCVMSGKCCHFEEYGHRLYVTTVELGVFVAGLAEKRVNNAWNGRGCPFQVNKLCGVHAIRPFGCRMYFCDPTAQEWQHTAYERFHIRLKRLHEELGVPYFYVEWRSALAAVLE